MNRLARRPVCRSAATSASRFLFERQVSRKSSTRWRIDSFSKSASAAMEMSLPRQADKIDVHRVNNTHKQGLQPFANQPRCKDICLFFRSNFSLVPFFPSLSLSFFAFHDYVSERTRLQQSKLESSFGSRFNPSRFDPDWVFIADLVGLEMQISPISDPPFRETWFLFWRKL